MNHSELFNKIYLLIDCNNFFVSCERIFRPDLATKPVLVLSNNDGCVIARSQEVKNLGIKMGVPFFKIQDLIKKHHIYVFSSNFNLYLDISNRVMQSLENLCQHVEVYSIDEAFLCFQHLTEPQALDLGFKIKNTIWHNIGIPVGVGIAKSKTLAKLANHYAKSHIKTTFGVHSVLSETQRIKVLQEHNLNDVWGIGKRFGSKLEDLGFKTAYDLATSNSNEMRKLFNINLKNTIDELNNHDCIFDNSINKGQMQIMWSRSFTPRIEKYSDLEKILVNFTVLASEKLRKNEKFALKITVFIRTSYFGQQKKYSANLSLDFTYPTNDSRILIKACEILLKRIYKSNFLYAKAGIILSDLVTSRACQSDLFVKVSSSETLKKSDNLMATLDKINTKKQNTLYFMSQGNLNKKAQFSEKKLLSPQYTTSFDELCEVK